ncbi:TRM11 family SAM-dependent methyltransferase [Lysinibacillus sp. LZ02]|uniref:TRM11 family SAM-dependent methyltransferase n=1 Tax=Lysinibacillus sp. LZ02 TaxID=3420668 RepID=UPI003D36C8AB
MVSYLYTYGWRPDETALCRMEMRAFFGTDTEENVLISPVKVEPSRSPFIRARLAIKFKAASVELLCKQMTGIQLEDKTYRVVSLNDVALGGTAKWAHTKRRATERQLALTIEGEPDLTSPDVIFGVVQIHDTFYFGELVEGKAVWLAHQERPQQYSTALSTKVARALVNIAVPVIEGKRVIDPCCGVGTVLVEALSMGIPIIGRDMNWFVTSGSRKNIAHFGLQGEVQLGPIEDVVERYDVAIIDMPYNVFTHSDAVSLQSIVTSARRIAESVLFVTVEPMDELLTVAGFKVVDRTVVKKGNFGREVLLCR